MSAIYRWRHQARVERMNEQEKRKKEFEEQRAKTLKELESVKEKIKKSASDDEKQQLQTKIQQIEAKQAELDKQFDDLRLQEKKTPWNVDTISKPGFAKTIINTKPSKPSYDELTEEEKEVRMRDFVKDNKSVLHEFGMLRRYDDSKKFLLDHNHLACEATANYLVIWCINLEMEKKTSLMEHVAHQCICMQYILELVSN